VNVLFYIGILSQIFNDISDAREGYDVLTQKFVEVLTTTIAVSYADFAIEECKSYCNQYWHDENLNSSLCSVSSIVQLFVTLKSFPLYNFLDTGLLRHLAKFLGEVELIDFVQMYEERFSSFKLRDLLFIKELKVTGENIPEQDHTLVASAILEHGITIGQLHKMCIPKYLHLYNTVILDFGRNLPDFYHFIKVSAI